MSSICVYLGANQGNDPDFALSVVKLGREIAGFGHSLIYGGSSLGLMGILANTVKEHGGQAIGIITEHLIDKEKPLSTLDELHVVRTMQERKLLMQEKADMFFVMPGGLGTLEEAFDTWNAIKIGLLNKPIGFLNTNGYFDHLFSFISSCEQHGFITKNQGAIPKIHEDVPWLIAEMSKALF